MPMKVDRSADMSVESFNSMFMKYFALVNKVVIKYLRGVPLDNTPRFSSKEDIVNFCYIEMRRLGTFSRFDAERAGGDGDSEWITYVGEQILAILRHTWQDHCRLNNRSAVRLDALTSSEDCSKGEQSPVLDSRNWDPDFDWSMESESADGAAECNSVYNLLESEAATAGMQDVKALVAAMRHTPELMCAPTAKAVAAVLNVTVPQASRAIRRLKELATDLRLA